MHLRPGSIIPWQDKKDLNESDMINTAQLLKLPISMVINRNENKVASGTVFLDRGISKLEITEKKYEYYTVTHKNSKSIQF